MLNLYYDLGFIAFINYSKVENTKLILDFIDLIFDLI